MDELTLVNSLRSTTAATYKCMAGYIKILNFPSDLQAMLDHVFCVFLVQSKYINQNMQESLKKLILNELVLLKNEGIEIRYRGQKQKMEVVLYNFSGDNVGIHQFSAIKQNWSGDFCRMCGTIDTTKTPLKVTSLNEVKLKTKADYDFILQYGSPSLKNSFGITSKCVFNELQYFHCFDVLAVDTMHDIHEGHSRVFVGWILQRIREIPTHWERIQNAINSFPYTAADAANPPHLPRLKIMLLMMILTYLTNQ